MTKKNLAIHSENILPIIKKWLYSEKDIFLRELISNATDALTKMQILKKNQEAAFDNELRIDITIDEKAKTLTIADTGIGMTEKEVETYIAQIAFSGAEEFMKKYEDHQEVIGHFGLGFYSSYMVSKNVEIQTTSYQKKSTPVHWSCDGSSSYTIDQGSRKTRGTEIILHLNEENLEFLKKEHVQKLLEKYCLFLPFPIYFEGKCVNETPPLWLKSPSECSHQDYLDFYRKLYPMEQDPVFWIHLNVDYPFKLQGILYFPKTHRRYEQDMSTIQLYCNRVYVSDHCKDLLPDYLLPLKGAMDSTDIPLNVSRSYLQVDQTVKQLASHISKKVADRLNQFHNTDFENYTKSFEDIEMVVKLGVLQDEKFYERVKDVLVWPNLENQWTTISQYLERNEGKTGKKVFYTTKDKTDTSFIQLYKDKGIEMIVCNNHIDTALLSYIEGKITGLEFHRIDSHLDESLLDPTKEKTLLDADGKSEAGKIAGFIQSQIDEKELEVEAKSLASTDLPAMIIVDEKQRRFRDYMRLTQGTNAPTLPTKKTFVVNTNNALIQGIYHLKAKDPDLAKDLTNQLFSLALLNQKELDPDKMTAVMNQNIKLFEVLLSKMQQKK